MKIGFLTASDISTANGYVTRILSELDQLKRKKMSVSVLSFLHIKHWKNKAGISDYVNKIRDMGHHTLVVPVFPDNQNPFLYKAVDQYRIWFIRRFIRKERIAILHCHATQAAYLGVLASVDSNLPVVYDMHGATIAEQANLWERNSPEMKRLEYVESTAVRGADTFISVSKALQAYRAANFPETSAESYIIPCAVNTERFVFNPSERSNLRELWGVDSHTPVFVYLGSAAHYQKIDKSLEIFKEMCSYFPNAHMLIISPQTDTLSIKKMALELGLDGQNLLYYSVDHNEVPIYLSACDFGFLLRDDLLLNNVSSPTKFGEYLSCGVPVITSANIFDVKSILEMHEIGFIYRESAVQLKSFVERVMPQRKEYSEVCRKYADSQYSWSAYGNLLMQIYETQYKKGKQK